MGESSLREHILLPSSYKAQSECEKGHVGPIFLQAGNLKRQAVDKCYSHGPATRCPSSVRLPLSLSASLILSSGPAHSGYGTFNGGICLGSTSGTCFSMAASASQYPWFSNMEASASEKLSRSVRIAAMKFFARSAEYPPSSP